MTARAPIVPQRPRRGRSTPDQSSPDAEGELAALQIATGAAIEGSGLLDKFDVARPRLIANGETRAMALANLESRATRAAEDLAAGRPVEPSLELTVYLASQRQSQLAGAVYLSYRRTIDALHQQIMSERTKILTAYKATLATDRKKAIAQDFAAAVAAVFSQLVGEYERQGRPIGDESCSAIARTIKSRLGWPRSLSAYWRYVRPLLHSSKPGNAQQPAACDRAADPTPITAAELQSLMNKAGLMFDVH